MHFLFYILFAKTDFNTHYPHIQALTCFMTVDIAMLQLLPLTEHIFSTQSFIVIADRYTKEGLGGLGKHASKTATHKHEKTCRKNTQKSRSLETLTVTTMSRDVSLVVLFQLHHSLAKCYRDHCSGFRSTRLLSCRFHRVRTVWAVYSKASSSS